jgi:vacuolar-type H+-ATPase subunit H
VDAEKKEEEILERAQKRAEGMVQDTEIVKEAELERKHMIDDAQEEARKIVYDAEDIADRIFGELEASLIEVKDSTDEILGRVGTWREKLRGYAETSPQEEYQYEGEPEE